MEPRTRRQALIAVGLGTLAAGCGIGSAGCGPIGFGIEAAGDGAARGHIAARPGAAIAGTPRAGRRPLDVGDRRDGVIYVPEGLTGPAPLVVLLHGATGSADGITRRLGAFAMADDLKLVILAPDSRGRTWDMIRGTFGPDVAFLDRALVKVFAEVAIDPKRVAASGFSDGASFAISLGLQNGDLFTHVAAFSPGFFVADGPRGRSQFFVSHGQQDGILPIESTSRRIVPALKRAGYDVRYREFNGSHTVPPGIAREAFEWMAARS